MSETDGFGNAAAGNKRSTYVRTARDDRLERAFHHVWKMATDPNEDEGRCLVLVGETGAGKTRALDQLFRKRLFRFYGTPDCEFASLSMPSPATLKVWGRSLLATLGYPLKSDLREAVIWEMVRDRLMDLPISLLHFDEFQHVSQTANKLQRIAILNTVKSLLIGIGGMPSVSLILSGLPEIVPFIEDDPQVRRRSVFVKFETLNPALDGDIVQATVARLATNAGCPVDDGTLSDLADRVLHAATGQLGQAISLAYEAISVSVARKEKALTHSAFAEAFEIAKGNDEDFNPFLVEDWAAIDARRVLLDDKGAYPAPHLPSVKESRKGKRGRRAA